jgi:hypothetical protein
MSDITEAVTQQQIADSILDDSNILGSWKGASLAETPAEAPKSEADKLADLATDRTEGQRTEGQPEQFTEHQTRELARKVAQPNEYFEKPNQQEPAQAAQQPATPEQVQQGIEQLDAFVQQHELNDPASAKNFASDLCQAFGSDLYQSGVNIESFGSTMAKVAVSALQTYELTGGDPSRLTPVSPAAAKAFTYDFLRAFGEDPRGVTVNEQLLANTVLYGALNFIDTYQRFGGRVTNLDQLNDPAAAEMFLGSFLKSFGIESPVDRAVALKLADAGGKYLLSIISKLGQIQPQQMRASSRRAAKRSASQNSDYEYFENPQAWNQRAAPTNVQQDFRPKARHPLPNMKSNRDLYDAETLADYALRRL